MRKLVDSSFEYPFKEKETPSQYAYKMMGEEKLANEHTFSIMHLQGRMASFNIFMEGKFGKFGRMPERVKGFGYNLDAAISGKESPIVMMDIGGGQERCCWSSRKLTRSCNLKTSSCKNSTPRFKSSRAHDDGLGLQEWDTTTDLESSQLQLNAHIPQPARLGRSGVDAEGLESYGTALEAVDP
jgi:hypothetical protein